MRGIPTKWLTGAVLLVVAIVMLGWTAWQTNEQQAINHDLYASIDTQQLVEERIIDLPEDGGACSLTLFVHDDWKSRPQERRLMSWFASDRRLMSLKAQCNFTLFTPSNQMFQSRWAPRGWEGSMPAVLLTQGQPHVGKGIYKKGGRTLPPTAKELGDQIAAQLASWPCPTPRPKPTPTPTPKPPVVTPVIPDIGPEPDVPLPADAFPWGLLGIGIVAAVVGVLYKHFRTPGGLA